jgi:hypothetical protein
MLPGVADSIDNVPSGVVQAGHDRIRNMSQPSRSDRGLSRKRSIEPVVRIACTRPLALLGGQLDTLHTSGDLQPATALSFGVITGFIGAL